MNFEHREQLRVFLGELDVPPVRRERLDHSDICWLARNLTLAPANQVPERRATLCSALHYIRRLAPGIYISGERELT